LLTDYFRAGLIAFENWDPEQKKAVSFDTAFHAKGGDLLYESQYKDKTGCLSEEGRLFAKHTNF